MKIVCIATSQIPSSAANSIQVMKACQALAQLGHPVHLLVPGKEGVSWEKLAMHYGLETRFDIQWLPSTPRLRRYDFSLRAVLRARSLKSDLAYIWPLQAAVFALLWRMPVLLELHGPPEGRFGPALFRLFLKLRPVLRNGVLGNKRCLPITGALADYLERVYRYRFSPGEVVISPNGVDLERYRGLPEPREARRQLGLPEKLTAGYTGHLYAGRGMGLLLELARSFPLVQFVWVGGRPEDVAEWKRRLSGEDISNVSLLGFIENSQLPLYQAAADILLMPYERVITGSGGGNSAEYCSPMKMFEYMACGRAILSSDLPVIREVLNESNSILCPPEDAPAWVKAFSELASDPQKIAALGTVARKEAEQFTWKGRAQRALEGFLGG